MKTLTSILIAASSIASIFAQANSPDTLPQPPFLKRAPEKCQWQITTKSSGEALGESEGTAGNGHSANSPKVTTVFKNGSLVFETTSLENGESVQSWCTGGIALMSMSGKPWVFLQGGGNSFENTDFSQSDFAGFNWVSQANFVGRQKVSGRPCLLFKDRVVTISPEQVRIEKEKADELMARGEIAKSNAHAAGKSEWDTVEAKPFRIDDYKVEVTAYIDEETRLPIALVYMGPKGKMIRTYSFQALSRMPPVPPDVLQQLQAYQQRLKILGG